MQTPLARVKASALPRQPAGRFWSIFKKPNQEAPSFQSLSTLRAGPSKGPLQPVEREHVLQDFYLVDQLGGRFNHSTYLFGVELDGRMALMLHPNDLLGALAQDANDDWLYYAALGERGREYALRVGVNAFMYTLCLDYKQDQVHIPFISKEASMMTYSEWSNRFSKSVAAEYITLIWLLLRGWFHLGAVPQLSAKSNAVVTHRSSWTDASGGGSTFDPAYFTDTRGTAAALSFSCSD